MSRSVMVMQILTKCGRCGALVEPNQMPSVLRGTNALFWRAATTCNVDASGTIAMDFADTIVLCPDCMKALRGWLDGNGAPGPTDDPAKLGDILAAEERERGLAALLRDVEGCCTDSWVDRCCMYFMHGTGSGKRCSDCPAYDFDDCCQAFFDDFARRLRALGVESGKAGETGAESGAVGDE